MDATKKNISKYDWYSLNSYMVNSVGRKTFIVDAQQRLTTLTLLIINLMHLGNSLGMGDGVRDFLKSRVEQGGVINVFEDVYSFNYYYCYWYNNLFFIL